MSPSIIPRARAPDQPLDSPTDSTGEGEGQQLPLLDLRRQSMRPAAAQPSPSPPVAILLCAFTLGCLIILPLLLALPFLVPSPLFHFLSSYSLLSTSIPPTPTPWQWPSSSTDGAPSFPPPSLLHPSFQPPPSHPSSPPRVSFILRAYSGYRQQMGLLFHSMQLFLPPPVLNDTILVLDDSDHERRIAALYPPWVQLRFEGPPPRSSEWKYSVKGKGYDQALYSNWLADVYTDADIICVLDPDMVFSTRTALYSMFRWDAQLRLYKPLISCLTARSGYSESHGMFPVHPGVWPHAVFCMAQLPVCVHRSTLSRVRQQLTLRFRAQHASAYSTLLPNSTSLDEFAVTYSLMTHSLQGPEPLCQYCVWSTFVMSDPVERPRYFFSIGAGVNDSVDDIHAFHARHSPHATMCPLPRASGHVQYLNQLAAEDMGTYASVANDLMLEGLCRGVSSDRVVDCLSELCRSRAYDDRSFQHTMARWEHVPLFATPAQEMACLDGFNRTVQTLQDWQRAYDSMEENRERLCGQPGHHRTNHSSAA